MRENGCLQYYLLNQTCCNTASFHKNAIVDVRVDIPSDENYVYQALRRSCACPFRTNFQQVKHGLRALPAEVHLGNLASVSRDPFRQYPRS